SKPASTWPLATAEAMSGNDIGTQSTVLWSRPFDAMNDLTMVSEMVFSAETAIFLPSRSSTSLTGPPSFATSTKVSGAADTASATILMSAVPLACATVNGTWLD